MNFEAALSAIDAANSEDPRTLVVRGSSRPWALGEGELATIWLKELAPEPSDALRLAVRGHHIRRWETPRASYPEGRAGYLKWRKHLYDVAAGHVAEAMRTAGYDEASAARPGDFMRKRNLASDAEAQTYEDVLCLVFLESQFADFAAKTDPEKLDNIVAKTLAKMSEPAKAAWQKFSR